MILEFSELATWRKKRNVICDARMCPSPSLEQAKSGLVLPQLPSPSRVESSHLGEVYFPATSAAS